jgi:NAD(P)-dependent dehydrogenase (short-subunit alcohol dehydrogenase family)
MVGSGVRALVTGGMSGIGAATASMLREAGHDVVIWDRAEGADVVMDVSDPDQVEHAMMRVLDSGAVPQIVVACAGVGHSGMLLTESPAEWDRVLSVNLTGVWLTIRAAASAMVTANVGGSIVVVSSVSGTLVDRNMGAYCVSKAGADMLVRVAAAEFGEYGIRVNAVGPGATDTPMFERAAQLTGWVEGLKERTPLCRLGQPNDIAQAVVAVLGLEWVTGQVIHADGGLGLHSPIDSYGQLQRVLAAKGSA